MLDILEKFLIRKGYCFSRLDGSTATNSRQTLVDDFNSSPSKQVKLWNKMCYFFHPYCWWALISWSGFPYINSSWGAWIESCQCKSRGHIWSKLESCARLTGPGQVLSIWTEAARCCFPPSCSWFPWGTCLLPSGVQTAAVQHSYFWENGKTIFWRCPGT